MVNDYVKEVIARRIAGDIVVSDNCGAALKRWRETFKATQVEVAKAMGITPSVIVDYEKSRRLPGVRFLRRFVDALFQVDSERGWIMTRQLAKMFNLDLGAIIDARDLSTPLTLDELVTAVEGVIVNSQISRTEFYGYTVIDSIGAIVSLSGDQFWQLMGLTTNRALIFTKVTTGRSPMIAVRVAPVKPAVVVLHGPKKVDPMAIRLADREGIPLVLSLKGGVPELVSALREVRASAL